MVDKYWLIAEEEIPGFQGRQEELALLRAWILEEGCREVALRGFGGIGKTALAVTLVGRIEEHFDYIFGIELTNAPSLDEVLTELLGFLSGHQEAKESGEDRKIQRLIQYLRERRCLVVLDNFETVMKAGERAGSYAREFEGYGRLLRRVAESRHRSCLLLTSREVPQEILRLEGRSPKIRSLRVPGLGVPEVESLLAGRDLHGPPGAWNKLVELNSGNPFALLVVSEVIREEHDGEIERALQSGATASGDIWAVLSEQFNRLSPLERELTYWLTVARVPRPAPELRARLIDRPTEADFRTAVASLRHRHLLEATRDLLGLQNVFTEFVTDRLIELAYNEITTGQFDLLRRVPLTTAESEDHVRKSQDRLILEPLILRLLPWYGGTARLEAGLRGCLETIRTQPPGGGGYTAGTILALLLAMEADLRGADLSNLSLWQVSLGEAELQDASFRGSDLTGSTFLETFGTVLSVAFQPMSESFAAGTAHGDVRFWRAGDGKHLGAIPAHTNWVRALAFSGAGDLLATASDDCTVKLWNLPDMGLQAVLTGNGDRMRSVAVSSDGGLIATAGDDGKIRLWSPLGDAVRTLEGHGGVVRAVAFHPSEPILASVGDDGTVRVWRGADWEAVVIIEEGEPTWAVAFNADGSRLAAGDTAGTIYLKDLSEGGTHVRLLGHTGRVWQVAFDPQDGTLASASSDGTVRLWPAGGKVGRILSGHVNWVRAVAFHPVGGLLASGGEDQSIKLWSTDRARCLRTIQGSSNRIWSISPSSDGTEIASASSDRTVRVWRSPFEEAPRTLRGHRAWVRSVAFGPDGRLVSGDDHGILKVWDTRDRRCLNTVQAHHDQIWSVAFSPDGSRLASGSEDRSVRVFEATTCRPTASFEDQSSWVISVTFSGDSNLLAVGDDAGFLTVYDLINGSRLAHFLAHAGQAWATVFLPEEGRLATGGTDGVVRVWNWPDERCFVELTGHRGWVWGVAASQDGRFLASAGGDHDLKLWDLEQGTCALTLEGHSDRAHSVGFLGGASRLASGGDDGTVRIWDLEGRTEAATLRADRPYERMDVTAATGLTPAQRASLRALGAQEEVDG